MPAFLLGEKLAEKKMSNPTSMKDNRLVWVAGVNTGVGKTFLTRHSIQCLKEMGVKANALKPFCSGGMDDVRELASAQGLSEAEFSQINMRSFKDPITPAKAAELEGSELMLDSAIDWIQSKRQGHEVTLVEGAGGLLSPIGFCWSLLDLIRAVPGEIWVVARNQLGVLNHLLLTINVLRNSLGAKDGLQPEGMRDVSNIKVWMFDVDSAQKDQSCETNLEVISRFEPEIILEAVPFFDLQHADLQRVKINIQKKIKKHLSDFGKSIH